MHYEVLTTGQRLNRLVGHTAEVIAALVSNLTHGTFHWVPCRIAVQARRDPDRTLARMRSTLNWLGALAGVFAGRNEFLKPIRKFPPRPNQKPPLRDPRRPAPRAHR